MPDHYYTSFRPHVKDFAEAYCPVCQKTNRICHILPDLAASETLYFGDRYYKDRNNPETEMLSAPQYRSCPGQVTDMYTRTMFA